jgi:SAM-dependent methyltransferase
MGWEKIYAQGLQHNHWPFSEIVSFVMRTCKEKDRSQTVVLELGSGTGNNLRFLAEEGFTAFGIEYSRIAVSYARTRLKKLNLDALVIQGDFRYLPFLNSSVDMVLDRGALLHADFAGLAQIASEVKRILKPNGYFYSVGMKGDLHPLAPKLSIDEPLYLQRNERHFTFLRLAELENVLNGFSSRSIVERTRVKSGVVLDHEFEFEVRN